jgi:hypothetical protein
MKKKLIKTKTSKRHVKCDNVHLVNLSMCYFL